MNFFEINGQQLLFRNHGETLAVDLAIRDKYVAAQNEPAAEAAGGSGGSAPRSLADLNGHPAAISIEKA